VLIDNLFKFHKLAYPLCGDEIENYHSVIIIEEADVSCERTYAK